MSTRRILTLVLLLLGGLAAPAQRWAQVQLPAPYDQGYYLDIFFLPSNTQYGWACDNDSGYVVRTTNGGQSWQGTRVTPTGFCHLEYIQFLSSTVGYCSGPCGVFKSTDGGASWTQLSLGVPDNAVWGGWFKSATEGWVTGGGCGRNNFYHTIDGGSSWTRFQDTTIKRSNLADPIWQSDMPAGVLYASGNGTLWKSTNDGASWAPDSYTGATSPWQEEISRSGSTFMVSCARNNCGNDYTTGGMRWTHDDGATWNAYTTGADMFGVFLLNPQTAWASGFAGNVWQTTNGGSSWRLRNCGLNGKNMDDITFLNDTTGWVVGRGIFRLAPARRILSDTVLDFLGACPNSSVFDTVWVTNENFEPSDWSIELKGTDAWMYRVANVIPQPLPACSRAMVVVEYKPTAPGIRTATMVIRAQRPDTMLVVQLSGQSTALNARPTDTLVTFNHRVGTPIDRVLAWFATAPPQEAIVNIQRVSGSTDVDLTATFPTPIAITGAATHTFLKGSLRDTGWVQARFRVTLTPCNRDTFITVKVYGQSPIIHTDTSVSLDAGCSTLDTLKIPVANTGNIDLTVYSANLMGLSPESFRVIGFKKAGPKGAWKIAPRDVDTLLLEFIPNGPDNQAVLEINHDDATTARGNVQPWFVRLRVLSNRVQATVAPSVINLGTVCTGFVKDTSYVVTNTGQARLSMTNRASSQRFAGLVGGLLFVNGNDRRNVPFRWTASGTGLITDTITVTIKPCDSAYTVIIQANVVQAGLVMDPMAVSDTVDVGGTITRRVVLRNTGSTAVTVTGVRTPTVDAELTIDFQVPTLIAPGDSAVITLTWRPTSVRTYTTALIADVTGTCTYSVIGNVTFVSRSNQVEVRPPLLSFNAGCSQSLMVDSVQVIAKGAPVAFLAPTISQTPSAFTIVAPQAPFTVNPATPVWVVVAYNPTVDRNARANLLLEFADGTSSISVPLAGTAQYASWDVQPTQLDFADLRVCDPPIVKAIGLQNADSLPVTIDVDASTVPAWLVISDLPASIGPSSALTIMATCIPAQLPVGTSTADVVLVDATCGIRKTIAVTATIVDGALVLAPDPVDAGRVAMGRPVERTAVIYNPTPDARTILDLRLPAGETGWTILDNVVGTTLQPGDTTRVRLQFLMSSPGVSNTRLTLMQSGRCTTTVSIGLVGEAVDPGTPPKYQLGLHIDEYRVAAGDRVVIPVHWDTDVSAAQLDSAQLQVDFSYLHYQVDSVFAGNLPGASVRHSYTNGRLNLMVTGLGPDFGKPGVVAVLEGTAHPAIPDSTLFVFGRKQVWSTDSVSVLDSPGLLIVDVCGPRNLVLLVQPTRMFLPPPQPVTNVLTIGLEAPYSEVVNIEVVNLLGNVVGNTVGVHIPQGVTTTPMDVSGLPSGAYVVRVSTGRGGLFMAPFVVTH
jgi:photosystem II stability/assembly factor-like uncharacterized protein